ncbi:hypothetical protein BYT27DRAFT_7208685 [Phlegmacium glaucopus]|nr:hypothetical protein BYT27DRAFT_7208685 [Phlegmacium glaucopus]
MTSTKNPPAILADSLAQFSKAAHNAFTEIESQSRIEVLRAASETRRAREETREVRAERDKLVRELYAATLEAQRWKQEAADAKAALAQVEIIIAHQAKSQGETIAELQREVRQWKNESRNREEHFVRLKQERCTQSSRIDELMKLQKTQESLLQEIRSSEETAQLSQLITKPQDIKPERYTHDQGEPIARRVHCNMPGQHPLCSTKTNLSEKTNHREKEEIEPREVKPQDVPIKSDGPGSELSLSQQSFKPSESKTRLINPLTSLKMCELRKAVCKPKVFEKKIPFASLKETIAKLSQDDVIIAVMGPTGSGKSTFIKLATGLDTGVGHNLQSCTSKINTFKLSVPELADCDVIFVDTPGFDDTKKSDVDILRMVADWLKNTYEKEILLSGLLYLHQITDNRMAGTPLKNLRLFEELCGKNALHNIILTTTWWNEVDEETGRLRENVLKSKNWRSMFDRGSTISRFLRTRESALEVIEPLIDAANAKSSLLLQQELVDMRTKLPETSSALRLCTELEDLVKKRQAVLERIRNAMKHSTEFQTSLPLLKEEYQRLKTQLDATIGLYIIVTTMQNAV